MSKKFLTVLGNGKNLNCKYTLNENEEEHVVDTCFIQEALVKVKCREFKKGDKMVIFLTEDARNKNWESENGLKKRLEDLNIEIIEKYIKDGSNEEEIFEVFKVMFDSIEDNDEIILDITNAFRYLPMLSLAVIQFSKKYKRNISVNSIYYGKFQGEGEIAPIINITDLYRILNYQYKLNRDDIEEDIDIDYTCSNLGDAYKELWKQIALTI